MTAMFVPKYSLLAIHLALAPVHPVHTAARAETGVACHFGRDSSEIVSLRVAVPSWEKPRTQ